MISNMVFTMRTSFRSCFLLSIVFIFTIQAFPENISHRRSLSVLFGTTNTDSVLNEGSTVNDNELKLNGCVCLVTGASRGIGKGIALELGKQGAVVYVTGTTSNTFNNADSKSPGTIEETADEINRSGGVGVAVCCDHANDDDVQKLMDQIDSEQGRLDILVNNAFRIPRGGVDALFSKFWEQSPDVWDTIHTVGLRSHFVATCKAMPLLFKARRERRLPRPFIAMISSFGGLTYTFNVAYGVGKAAVDRLAKDMAVDLDGQDICVVSFWPGVVLTERTELMVKSGEWEQKVKIPLDNAESPAFTGKAIAAIATDPDNMLKTGTYQVVAEIAEEYGFTEDDGRQPPSIRSLRFLLPSYAFDEKLRSKIPASVIPNWKLPFFMMAQGRPPKPDEPTS